MIGPCSIHDPAAAKEYAARLLTLREALKGELEIVMRVYFENRAPPSAGKGSSTIPIWITASASTTGCASRANCCWTLTTAFAGGGEFLDMITPQYVADLMSWGAIGARTTESRVHRELASGLSCPVGFKTVPMAPSRWLSMRLTPPARRTVSCRSPSGATPPS